MVKITHRAKPIYPEESCYCFFCRFASLAKLQSLIAETNLVSCCGICLPIVFLFVSFEEI